jgi:putative ABC transport system substrate-binding protein
VLPAVRRGLETHGFLEGKNVTVEYRYANGQYDRLPSLIAEFVQRPVNLIVLAALDIAGYRAGKAATATIPIVFVTGTDPVKSGLVPNFSRPGGNLTGVSLLFRELGAKRLELLHELLPRVTSIGVLVNPANDGGGPELSDVQNASRALGLQVRVLNARTDREIDDAFAALAGIRVGALLVTTDPFFFARANQIVAAAAALKLPALYIRREFVLAGGLLSYGSNSDETYRVIGDYAGRILAGAKPGDLPVQQPIKLELVINLITAKALKLDIPPTLLARADEVIE